MRESEAKNKKESEGKLIRKNKGKDYQHSNRYDNGNVTFDGYRISECLNFKEEFYA